MSKYLVTPALPYANGAAHLGHLVEQIQVNIFVRALRMAGEDVLCVCGADSHGTPIELAARKEGVDPEAYAARVRASHAASFSKYGVAFDGGYGTTHTPENRKHAERHYAALKAAGHVDVRDVEQLYDPEAQRFLPDRFVKGTCPKCGAADQYGDSCEACGSTYRPTELIDPRSVISGATPVLKSSAHHFFRLGAYADRLKAYLARPGVLGVDMQNFLEKWFADGLKDWDISRDGPYFGFEIPGAPGKYFYVWLDAPIGYQSLTEIAKAFEPYWRDPSTKIFHFIGKDILYFHALFWPAMLMATGDTLPTAIRVHGMLTVNGVKMSKSRGTFILADDFAAVVEPEALRYYYAAKLTPRAEDIDLSFEDFTNRVNADLVNNVINLVSRTVPQLHKVAGGRTGTFDAGATWIDEVKSIAAGVEGAYRELDTARAVRDVVSIADRANKYLQDAKPWAVKDAAQATAILTTALWAGKVCVALLKPVLPAVAGKLEQMLGGEAFTFANAAAPLPAQVAPYERLFERVELAKVQSLVKEPEPAAAAPAPKKKPVAAAPPTEISIDAFLGVDLRAAKVIAAQDVAGSDKLIACTLDVGALGTREVFTGLRPHVAAGELLGRTVVVVANLAPRKMKFGVSQGMILAAGDAKPVPLFVDGAAPGDRVR